MGKASSSKKVARAARAGGGRRPGQRRHVAYPLTIAAIVVVGIVLVWFARSEREASAEPRAGEDHWHSAYGIFICDTFQPGLSDVGADTLGIHTHDDGVVHIHPFLDSAAGTNAQYQIFFDQVGLTLTDSSLTLPDGTTYEEGVNQCGAEGEEQDAQLRIARWARADEALDGKEPSEIVTEDFGNLRFRADCEAFTIAFAPEDAEIPPPDSIPTLANLSDVVGTEGGCPGVEGEGTSTTTSAPASSSTEVPPSTTTSSP